MRLRLEFFLKPEIDQSVRGHAALSGDDPEAFGHVIVQSAIGQMGFEINLERGRPRPIPIVRQAVRVPKFSDLLIGFPL